MKYKNQGGFTLIELMITVVVIGILSAIAYPSYQQYLIRSKRAAVQAQMMDMANREQQFFLANKSYASDTTLGGFALPAQISSVYACSAVAGTGTVPSFLITCTPSGTQASDGVLTLNSEGVKTPASKW